MLVSIAKPWVCKHRGPQGEAANSSVDQLQFIRSYEVIWITKVVLEIHATIIQVTVVILELIYFNAPTLPPCREVQVYL